MNTMVRVRSNKALGLLWLAVTLGSWPWGTGHADCYTLLSPSHSSENAQEPRELEYPANADSVVTWPLPRLLKAVPNLKGLEPDESQAELPDILRKVGANVRAFFEDFPNTASVERIYIEGLKDVGGLGGMIGVSGPIWDSHTQKFQYLALARRATSGVGLDEYRTNAKGQVVEPGGSGGSYVVTKGFVSMPLYFYPDYQADSTFRYLGRQVISKRQTYVVAFAQRPGVARLPGRISIKGVSILVLMQGIAWFDSSTYQVLRMHTDLLTSKEQIDPKRETTEIEFQEVRFKESPQTLWLPRQVVVTVDMTGHAYKNRHSYSDFKLFTVGTEQEVQTPGEAHQPRSASAKDEEKHETVFVNKDGLKYVWIPPGTFMMGCSQDDNECFDSEKPSHQVTISRGFWLGQTPVTVGAYKRFAQSSGKVMPPEPSILGKALNSGWSNEQMPIVSVTWDEARDYCSWAGGRLSTEAEWEYASRGGSTEVRYGPLNDVAWYADNSGQQRLDSVQILKDDQKNFFQRLKDNGNGMHEVGQKRANGFGLFDVLGNVWEWVSDWYGPNYYQASPSQDPPGPASGTLRVFRGGCWYNAGPRGVRVSDRGRTKPCARNHGLGFRCVAEVGSP